MKQLPYIVTVSAGGAVPIAYRTADANTVDDVTHIETWDSLVPLIGSVNFIYAADPKLCSAEAMGHIAGGHGRFVTIISHGRKEDTWFCDPDNVWRTFVVPVPSNEGYRVIWVHSTSNAARDANGRQARVEAGLAAIETVRERLSSPKSRLRAKVAAEEAATAALAGMGATRCRHPLPQEAEVGVSHRGGDQGRRDCL